METTGSVEERLQRIEDQLAIHRLLDDYAAFLDARDYERYAMLFAPNGEWIGGVGHHKGRAAIRAMLVDLLGPPGSENRTEFHLLSNARVDVEGDRATATSRYLFVRRGSDGGPQPALAGLYTDMLVRADGRWLIARRIADDILPAPEEWATRRTADRQ